MSEKLQPYMKLGRIGIYRPDTLNWVVEGGGEGPVYYPTLAGAIRRAAFMAADTKAKTAADWLIEFQKVVTKLEKIAQTINNVAVTPKK